LGLFDQIEKQPSTYLACFHVAIFKQVLQNFAKVMFGVAFKPTLADFEGHTLLPSNIDREESLFLVISGN
jgi:hypothetical protein